MTKGSSSTTVLRALGSYGLALRRARGDGLRETLTFVAPALVLLLVLAVAAGSGVVA